MTAREGMVAARTSSSKNSILVKALQIVFVGILLVCCGYLLLLRRKHGGGYAAIEPSRPEITPVDEQLKDKAIRIVEEHISDADFSVEQLGAALGMSRGHLYKRLLAITGKTPIAFIRTIRIKRGHQLLEQSGESVSQIAWTIGMSPKQFAKYFKEEYGLLPSEFIRKQESDKDSDKSPVTE